MNAYLLAIDLGLRSGLAALDARGALVAHRSTNFGSRSRLKKAVWGVVREFDGLHEMVVEGDRDLGKVWQNVADKQSVEFTVVAPETWRKELLVARLRRTGTDAKEAAGDLAREFIEFSEMPGPTSLRHDAAEAICIALWRGLELDLEKCGQFVDEM